jgi:hypothetical protein
MGFLNSRDFPVILIPEKVLSVIEFGIADKDVEVPRPKVASLPSKPQIPPDYVVKHRKIFRYRSIFESTFMLVVIAVKSIFYAISLLFALIFLLGFLLISTLILSALCSWIGIHLEFGFLKFFYNRLFEQPISRSLWLAAGLLCAILEAYAVGWIQNWSGIFTEIENFEEKKSSEQIAEEEKIHNVKLQEWENRVEDIQKENLLIQRRFDLSLPDLLVERKKLKYQEIATPYIRSVASTAEVRRGSSESFFEEKLREKYGDSIMVNQLTTDGVFFPDYVYVSPKSGFHIDIEIDEPYTLAEGIPIHFAGCDDQRDFHFVSNNWIVIRFTEEQVVKRWKMCLYVLDQVIEILDYRGTSGMGTVVYHSSLATKKWTQEKSLKLARKKFREQYLLKHGLIFG